MFALSGTTKKTKVIDNNLNPEWNEVDAGVFVAACSELADVAVDVRVEAILIQ